MINLHKFGWCILAIVCQLRPGVAQQMGSLPQSSTGTSFGALFIETRGPRSEGVLFTSDSVATAAVYDNGFDIRVSERSSANCEQRTGATLRFRFETAGAAARAYGSCVQPTEVNYMIGSAAEHRTRRRSFAAARIDAVATGCDAVLRREFTRSVDGLEGELRYDLEFAAGAAVDGVVVAVAGLAGPLRIDPSGRLVAPTALGDVTQTAPTSWERLPDGTQRRLASRFVLLDDARYGFEVDDRSGAPLTIDPTLLYSTYLGGTGSLLDLARAVATDYNGGCVVVGDAGGASFPASIGAFDTTFGGGWDMFVARVSPGGVVLWATFIGGSADDQGWGVAFGPLEEVWAVGATQSTDFPTANAFAATFSGVWDAAVCRLSADGSTLLYGSYFGGPNDDQALAACSDATGDLFVAGHAGAGFPVTPGAADVSYGGAPWDGFAMRVSPGIPAPIWSTYLGGGGRG